MWNHNEHNKDDDSWEVRAFEEDTTFNLLGCTWPPRSYTCTFCWREFRSAQALGGHMNVHRQDRAKLVHHQMMPPAAQQLVVNGLCLLYPLPIPNNNNILIPTTPLLVSPSTLLPISPFATNKPNNASSLCHSSNTEPISTSNSNDTNNYNHEENVKDTATEELDLELRLGRKLPPEGDQG